MVEIAETRHDGGGGAVPLVIAPGLFGSARNWGTLARRWSDRGPVVAVDMRNHGLSGWDDRHAYADLAGDLLSVVNGLGGRADVLGHSMGGKAAMALALGHPKAVRRLVVVDIAPVAYGHSQIGYVQAMQALDLDAIGSRGEADLALSAEVPDAAVRAFLLQSLDIAAKSWRLDLTVLEREMPGIMGWDVPGRFEGPALFLTGADSDYVLPSHRADMIGLFPQATFHKIAGAGHWLHAERPRETEAAVRAFLDA